MKILFHLNSMGRGGAERVVSILSKGFAQQGHDVIVATQWFSEKEYALDERVRRISVGLTDEDADKNRLQKAFCRLFRLRSCVTKENPDLVISFCCKANYRSAFTLFGKKIPLLISVRNDPKMDYASHKLANMWMEHKATGCVFQTPDAQAFFSPKLQKKSKIIFNPIAENYLTEEIEDKIQAKDRKKEIVTAGRIAKQKNHMLLLHAFQKIAATYPEYTLKIYGDVQDQECLDEMQAYIKQHHLEERIYILGATDSIREEIANASLFVLSSDYEGMPNALMEALVMGIPSISTDCPCGGSRLLIEDGVSGLLTPVGDVDALSQAMDTMLQDIEHAHCMGQEARKIKEKVHPDTICREWMNYIEELIR